MVRNATGAASLAGCPGAGWTAVLLALASLFAPATVSAAEGPTEGLVVQVPNPVTTEATHRLRSLLHGPLKRFEQGAGRQGGRFVLLCDFNPDGRRADGENFGACHDLATFLRSMSAGQRGVRTVAYIHGEVRRHSVLPALACNDLVFSPTGRLGQVAAPGKVLGEVESTAYRVLARNRFPVVLIRKMFEPDLEVVRLGNEFHDGGAKPPAGSQPVPELVLGETAFYSFEQARALGLSEQVPAATLADACLSFGLPARTASARPLDRTVCWHIPLQGAITGELVEGTKRRVERALRGRAGLLIFELRCAGGDSASAAELGRYLASLGNRDPDNPVQTVAYVTSKARNLATFLAFSCDKIVMQREDDGDNRADVADDDESNLREAQLGGLGLYLRRHPNLEPIRKELSTLLPQAAGQRAALEKQLDDATSLLEDALQKELEPLLRQQMYPPALAAALCNRSARVYLVERRLGSGGRTLLTDEEYRADQAGPKVWRSLYLVKPWQNKPQQDGRYLTLTAPQARELEIATAVVKNLAELYEYEGLTPRQVRTAEADWLDHLADFLRDPVTSAFLVMIGITCLILELKMPGVGLPGVLAAISFVLFFWAHSQLNGQITWLAILLFLLGLVLIGLEVFVIPGFGVCGISGILLVLISLGLVTFGHWPQTSAEWVGMGNTIAPFGLSLLGSLVAVSLVVRYLPHIPVLNRLMLRTAEETAGDAGLDMPMHAELQALLGAIGVAATPLRPAGKTQFGDRFVDVVAEGGYIMPGTRVQVIEVEGNRVVVKEV